MTPEVDAPILSVRGLRRTFGDVVAVEGLDLDLASGECVAMIGHNVAKLGRDLDAIG